MHRQLGLIVLTALLVACRATEPTVPAEPPSAPGITATFTDVTAGSGLDFVHDTGLSGRRDLPEVMGGGVALFDADGDADLDLYLLDGGARDAATASVNRFYRLGESGRYEDRTDTSGLGHPGYGMGVAVADLDNDGDADLHLTNLGPNALFLNDGAGVFTETTEAAGVTDDAWGASTGFVDFDLDGRLDLMVVNYVENRPELRCLGGVGEPDYCAPDQFEGVADRLYRNLGDARFEEVGESLGLAADPAPGLGLAFLDIDEDGRPDLFVANDGEPNQLWMNREDGLHDEAVQRGVAVNERGESEASMGVSVGDVDGDEDLDLFLTHLRAQTNTLYLNEGGRFRDATGPSGLGAPSLPSTGFGTAMADFDHDGDLDVVTVNGHVNGRSAAATASHSPEASFRADLGQRPQYFENEGVGRFRDATASAGALGAVVEVGRGLAMGDLDGDGDVDLVSTALQGPARLLRNDTTGGSYLRVHVLDPNLRRHVHGALIGARLDDRWLVRPVQTLHGYLGGSEPTVSFGLGDARTVENVRVRWPDGTEEDFGRSSTDLLLQARRGSGELKPAQLPAHRLQATGDSPTPSTSLRASSTSADTTDDLARARANVDRAVVDAEPQVVTIFTDARSTLEDRPSEASSWGRLGVLHHGHRQPELALPCYARAAELAPDEATWPYLQGVVLAPNDPAAAERRFSRTLELDPNHVPALVRRARARTALGRRADADADHSRALELDPRCTACLLELGRSAEDRGELREAVTYLRRALNAAPGVQEPRLVLARVLAKGEQHESAAREREAARGLAHGRDLLFDPLMTRVDAENTTSGAVFGRAQAHHARGRTALAIAELDRFLTLAPDHPNALNNRSLLRRTVGDSDGALADLDQALALDPDNAVFLLNRARLRQNRGEHAAARVDVDRVLATHPDHEEAGQLRRDLSDD
ncbi:MAG: FG-GAP-like repeat-containing protein [Acidobacteriota bacterium]